MNMKPGEIVDKWTILRMKLRATPDNNSVLGLTIAHGTATEHILSIGDPNLLDLVEINARIWTLESMLAKVSLISKDDVMLRGCSFHLAGAIATEITALNKVRQASIARIDEIGELNAQVQAPKEEMSRGEGKVE